MRRFSRRGPARPYVLGLVMWCALTVCAGVIGAVLAGRVGLTVPWWALALLACNGGTFLLYGADKFFAMLRTQRVPEIVLHGAAFCGGSAGALLAMYAFRHKTQKISFQFVLVLLILIQCGLVVLFWPEVVSAMNVL